MMVHERNSDTLSSARQHKRLLRLFLVAVMLTMVVLAVPLFAFSSGSASAASSSGRPVSGPKLLPFAKSSGSQVDTPNWNGNGGFGFALVGSAPAGRGSSVAAIDEATDTIYVGNG